MMKKKLLFFGLLVLLSALFVFGASSVHASEYKMGDVNMDADINTRDVVLIKQSIVGLTELTNEQKQYADVYDDGTNTINTRDVVLILQYIVGMDVELEHSYDGGVITTEPTCEGTGVKTFTCVNCGDTYTEEVAANGHSYGEWVTTKEPTVSEDGTKERTCACGEKETETIAATGSVGLAYELNADGVSCTITGIGTCTDTKVFIPTTLDGYKVTSIGKYAFVNCTSLTSILIPDTVTSIGESAFYDCTGLVSVQIGNSLKTVEQNTFFSAAESVTVTVSENNPYLVVVDGWKLASKNDPDASAPNPSTPDLKFTVTFRFLDPVTGEALAKEIARKNIGYGNATFAPPGYMNVVTKFENYVLIGWDSDGDGVADEGYKNVKKNLTVNAVFRVREMFTVKFYDTPTHYTEVQVKEGEAIDTSSVTITPEIGKTFKQWINADASDRTTLDCAWGNATFVAQYTRINSVIPMVEKGTITVDGIKEAAWDNATYLPVNEERHADVESGTYYLQQNDRPTNNGDTIRGIESSWITADAWLLWDGDYIYMLVEVSDKTLTYRNPLYILQNYNAWLNDNVEAYFNFEQNAASNTNLKKLGIDALGFNLFANSIAIYGQNSTHFEEMEGAARSALGYYENWSFMEYTESDLTAAPDALENTDAARVQYDGYTGTKNYSYRVEFKFAAKTEGVPDTEHYPVDENGRLPEGYEVEIMGMPFTVPALDIQNSEDKNDPAKTDMAFYRFTDGEKLQVGSFVRFNLQINDLLVTRDMMDDPNSGFYEGDPMDFAVQKENQFYDEYGTAFLPPFVPAGHTQYNLSDYVTFALGGKDDAAKWEVYELKGNVYEEAVMLDADGNEIVQGSELFTVQIAQ